MSRDYEVINDLTEEDLVKSNEQLQISNVFYVYYDDTGNITAISNEKTRDTNIIQTTKNIVEDFLVGKKHFANFKVKLQEAKKEIVEKEFKIESYVDLIKINPSSNSCQFNLIIGNGKVKFISSSNIEESIDIPFFIVEKGNFHKVIETIVINTSELTADCERSFNYDLNSVWVITRKYFKSYRIINEGN